MPPHRITCRPVCALSSYWAANGCSRPAPDRLSRSWSASDWSLALFSVPIFAGVPNEVVFEAGLEVPEDGVPGDDGPPALAGVDGPLFAVSCACLSLDWSRKN